MVIAPVVVLVVVCVGCGCCCECGDGGMSGYYGERIGSRGGSSDSCGFSCPNYGCGRDSNSLLV